MNETTANAIYDLLQEHCEASDYWRENFVHEQTHGCREYRFQGALGFGGKFYSDRDAWRVGCYREDDTPERLAMIDIANAALVELRKAHA